MTLPTFLPRIESGERARFVLAATAFVCVAATALIARAAGDALFLSRIGSGGLPVMYVLGAAVSGFGAWICARVAPRLSTASIATVVSSVLIASNLLVLATLAVLPVVSRAGAYLVADVSGRIPVVLYWALASEVFDSEESRRLFGLIGATGTLACLPTGFLVGPMARRFGVASLIGVACLLLIGFVLAARALQRHEPRIREVGERGGLVTASRQSAWQLHRRSQFIAIAALVAVTALVQTLIDFQFKSSLSSRASGAALAAIFGHLYAWASLAALFIQLFLVHRILRWGGVLLSLTALPFALLAASAVVVQTASAAWVYATKTIDVTLNLTINGTARQMLYRGVRSESRLQARALAEGLYQPLAVALAGCALALTVGSLTIRTMAGVAIAGCIVWALVARSAWSRYVAGLLELLKAARFGPGADSFAHHEREIHKYVMDALNEGSPQQVRYLATVLPHVLPLATHGDAEVRRVVVRAAATGELRADARWMRERLQDESPGVRGYAAAALVNSSRPADVNEGLAELDRLIAVESSPERLAAAEAIGEIRRRDPTADVLRTRLQQLLLAPEEEVLEAALQSCLAHPDPALIPAILPLLMRRHLAADAADALVAIGPRAIQPVASFVRSTGGSLRAEILKKLARAMGRRGDAGSFALVRRMLGVLGPEDRGPVYQALGDIARRHPRTSMVAALDEMVLAETREAAGRVSALRSLGAAPATQLVRSALSDVVRCHVRHVFLLLDARVPEVNMIAVHATFVQGTREGRSQVLELLHNVVPGTLENPCVDLLGTMDGEEESEPGDTASVLTALLDVQVSDWVTAGALYAAAELGVSLHGLPPHRFLTHPDPIVREMTLAALERFGGAGAAVERPHSLTADADRNRRELAKTLGSTG